MCTSNPGNGSVYVADVCQQPWSRGRTAAAPACRRSAYGGAMRARYDGTVTLRGYDRLVVSDGSEMLRGMTRRTSISRGDTNLPTAMSGARIAAGLLGISRADALSPAGAVSVPRTPPGGTTP